MIPKMTNLILKITFLKMTFLKRTFLSRNGYACASIAAPRRPSRRAAATNMDHHQQTH